MFYCGTFDMLLLMLLGSSFVFRESITFEETAPISRLLSLYTSSLVLSADVTTLTSSLQTFFEEELTTVGSFQLYVLIQDECKGMNRSVQKLVTAPIVMFQSAMFLICFQSFRQPHRTHRFERNVRRGEQSNTSVQHQRHDDDVNGRQCVAQPRIRVHH